MTNTKYNTPVCKYYLNFTEYLNTVFKYQSRYLNSIKLLGIQIFNNTEDHSAKSSTRNYSALSWVNNRPALIADCWKE